MNDSTPGGRSPARAFTAPTSRTATSSFSSTLKRCKRLRSKFLKVRPREWLLLVKMSGMLAALLVRQRLVSLPRLMEIYDTEPIEHPWLAVTPSRLFFVVTGLVRVTLRDRYCMKRSILIFHFLRKWGYDARIHFGVAKESDSLKGHAWVDLDGHPVAERDDPRRTYVVTYSYPLAVESK